MSQTYKIIIENKAEKDLNKLDILSVERIMEKIEILNDNPIPNGSKKLEFFEGYRLILGKYRILYTIDYDKKIVSIYSIKKEKMLIDE
jgi:mRNA interferase RelE/StbE